MAKYEEMMERLAVTLGVETNDILGFKKKGNDYFVALRDGQNFWGVHVQAADLPDVEAADEQRQFPKTLPPDLWDYYEIPERATVKQLKTVGRALKIPYITTMNKKHLIEEIELYKQHPEWYT